MHKLRENFIFVFKIVLFMRTCISEFVNVKKLKKCIFMIKTKMKMMKISPQITRRVTVVRKRRFQATPDNSR